MKNSVTRRVKWQFFYTVFKNEGSFTICGKMAFYRCTLFYSSSYIVLFLFKLENKVCFLVPTHGITCNFTPKKKKKKSVALERGTRKSSVGLIWILCSPCELAHLFSFCALRTQAALRVNLSFRENWQGWQCFWVTLFKETTTKSRKSDCNRLSECSWKLSTWSLMWLCKVSWLRLCSWM